MSTQFLFLALSLLIACKRQDPTPEYKDPIYMDMVHQLEEAEKNQENMRKEVESSKKEYEMADQQNGEIKLRRQTVFDVQAELDRAAQKTRFLELELERRKEYARKSYLKAFGNDKEWPDPSELRYYQANKRLTSAPKSYDQTHKQRLQERAPAAAPKKAASGGQH